MSSELLKRAAARAVVSEAASDTVTIPKDELYELLDIINEMVSFCSISMPSERYYATASPCWIIAHRAAGNNEDADRLLSELRENRRTYFASPHDEKAPRDLSAGGAR